MHVHDLMTECHNMAQKKGFWQTPRDVGTLLMLIVSELGEALEADRKGKRFNKVFYDDDKKNHNYILKSELFEKHIKDTFEDEIADVFIRLVDLAAGLNIDLEWHISQKMSYNSERPYKHNKKY